MYNILQEKLTSLNFILDNDYLHEYIKLLVSNIETKYSPGKTQRHHIIPRWYYASYDLPVDNSSDNLINLYFKDHILAHYYLSLCTEGKFKYAMQKAFLMLTNFDSEHLGYDLEYYQKIKEESYEARLGVSPPNKGKPMSEEQKRKISMKHKGKKASLEARKHMSEAHLNMIAEKRANIIRGNQNKNYKATEETKRKQSASLMNHIVTEETRRKIGNSNSERLTGGRWCNNGVESKYLRPGESLPEGFVYGTLGRDKKWANDGIVELKCKELPEGFNWGRLNRKKENKEQQA